MQRNFWWILGASALLSAISACEGEESPSGPGAAGAAGKGSGGSSGSSAGSGGTSSSGASGGGTAGTSGASGVGGSSGTAGASGTSGAGGSGGAAGSAGTAGSSGANGSSGDAGPSTDSGAGGTAGVGSVACASGNVCDDFEAYRSAGGFGPWQQNGTNGTLAVEQTHAFSGQQAAHFLISPGANRRVQLQRTGAPLFPATNNTFWGRVMVWASDLPGMSDMENKNVHYDVIQASGTEPGEYRIAGMGNVLLNYEPHDCYYGTNKVIPEDRWACWEWLYDGTNNVIEFYIDGQLQARVASKGQGCVDGTDSVWDAPTFNRLRIGFVNYQSKAETTHLWMDDFAAGPARIGCPAAGTQTH